MGEKTIVVAHVACARSMTSTSSMLAIPFFLTVGILEPAWYGAERADHASGHAC